ncbi:MAG: trigger factor, partial [Pseudomonadota bacterium]
ISNEDIEKKLAELQQVNAQLQEVDKRRAVKVGDFAVVDYEGFLGNEAIEGEKVVDHVLEVGSGSFLPKFEEQLVGLKKGDKKDILVTVPEDHSKKDLAAKEVTFRVEIKGIKEKIIHELNDDFAKDLGEFETLAELRERIKENLERQGRVKVESELKDKILDRLVEENPFEVPSSMVTQHLQYMINETEKRLAFQGLSMEKAGISLDGLRENYKNQAEKEVRGSLLLEEIGKKESIEVDEKEIENRIVEIANRVGQTVETVRDYYETKDARERLRSGLMTEKTLDFIINSAKIEEEEKSKNDTDPNSD